MLEVVHVTKRYRKVLANDDINLTIEDGRIGVLLGPNGAGKSTIIKCIMGFLKYQGQIQVNGLENKSIEAKKIMGYIPEIPSLYPIKRKNSGMSCQKGCSRNCPSVVDFCRDHGWYCLMSQ